MKSAVRALLSNGGSDRATGYGMNNKIVSLPQGLLCTGLESDRQNRWALVDRDTGATLQSGSIGSPGLDNHCGAALAKSDDIVHALIGGHHGPLEHHTLEIGKWVWQSAGVAGERATYPSATVDLAGKLHVFYRCGSKEHWSLNYVRREGERWSDPIELVLAHKPGYIYWTNGATTGSDGTIHLVFGNARTLDGGAIHYGASHIQSRDEGRSWSTSNGEGLGARSIAAVSVPFLGDAGSADRAQSIEEQRRYETPGPENYNYQQMNLSNPATDARGALHVVLHHNRLGTAALWTLLEGEWSSRELSEAVLRESNFRVHPQSSLSIDSRGTLHAALMVEPTEACVWGPPGTYVVWVTVEGQEITVECVSAQEPEVAQWLPALEHPTLGGLDHAPALMYTRGRNAGGFGDNQNELETAVHLVMH